MENKCDSCKVSPETLSTHKKAQKQPLIDLITGKNLPAATVAAQLPSKPFQNPPLSVLHRVDYGPCLVSHYADNTTAAKSVSKRSVCCLRK
jgi:hypothetical protein